jgi:hypothetical protein
MASQSVLGARRFDLDWIRIAAFGLLILYHVGMVFVTWYYHVKSTHVLVGLEPLMQALNPWRLCLLFLVAGMATRFMATSTVPAALLRRRSARLLVPLIFGMAVIVPPQPYWEIVSRHIYNGDFISFYTGRYFAFAREFCTAGPCLVLPTWNHLWFVAYLWVYTVVMIVLTALLPGAFARAELALQRVLSSAGILVLPALLLAFYRLVLFPSFPQNDALIGDWYNHALYFTIFALGFVLASSEGVQKEMVRWRWTALAIASALFVCHLAASAFWPPEKAVPLSLGITGRVGYGLYQWCCIVAVLGFARGAVTQDSKARRYLTEAIFPYYIVHQTVIVGCAFALRDKGQPAWIEAAIILAATAASCALTYEIVKRISWLRPLFGLKPRSVST